MLLDSFGGQINRALPTSRPPASQRFRLAPFPALLWICDDNMGLSRLVSRAGSPSADELGFARRVVAAFDEAQATGGGTVLVGGQLMDLPIVVRAQRLLEAAGGDP